MDLTLLRAFVTIARVGNLTRAATQLHLTQPAVSLQIKNLQETLGISLFARTAHGLALTHDEAGARHDPEVGRVGPVLCPGESEVDAGMGHRDRMTTDHHGGPPQCLAHEPDLLRRVGQ